METSHKAAPYPRPYQLPRLPRRSFQIPLHHRYPAHKALVRQTPCSAESSTGAVSNNGTADSYPLPTQVPQTTASAPRVLDFGFWILDFVWNLRSRLSNCPP